MGNKSRSMWCGVFVSLVVAVVLAGSAQAGTDPYTPSYRGAANSVHAIFTRLSTWEVTLFESVGSAYPLDDTVPQASDDGADVTVELPNFIDTLPLKLMRIQLFFDGPVSGEDIEGEIIAYDPTGPVVDEMVGSSTGNLRHHYFDFELSPNPDWEQIVLFENISGGVVPGNLLSIEIDTVSVPEPATLGVLVIGGLLTLIYRRKQGTN